jgi:PhnB protein
MLDSYLFFNGNCAEAMRFYERTLGGKLDAMMTYADSPDAASCAGVGDTSKVMHACLVIDGRMLMASDMPDDQPAQPGGFALALNYPTAAEAQRIFEAMSQGGQVTMPMGKTFWAETFGMLTDRFGIPWMVGGGLVPKPE